MIYRNSLSMSSLNVEHREVVYLAFYAQYDVTLLMQQGLCIRVHHHTALLIQRQCFLPLQIWGAGWGARGRRSFATPPRIFAWGEGTSPLKYTNFGCLGGQDTKI